MSVETFSWESVSRAIAMDTQKTVILTQENALTASTIPQVTTVKYVWMVSMAMQLMVRVMTVTSVLAISREQQRPSVQEMLLGSHSVSTALLDMKADSAIAVFLVILVSPQNLVGTVQCVSATTTRMYATVQPVTASTASTTPLVSSVNGVRTALMVMLLNRSARIVSVMEWELITTFVTTGQDSVPVNLMSTGTTVPVVSDSVTGSVRVAARSVNATDLVQPSCSVMRPGCVSVRTTRRGPSATRAKWASLDCQTRCVKHACAI